VNKVPTRHAVALTLLLLLCLPALGAQRQPEPQETTVGIPVEPPVETDVETGFETGVGNVAETVMDGVYSEMQATRGEASYTAFCSGCHGDALEGVSAPALTGDRFIERWREAMLDTLYGFITERMPPGRGRDGDPISDNEYVDILTYILKVNAYPAGGDELAADRVGRVMLVGQDGPQPVPDGSLIVAVGCLARDPDGRWLLVNTPEPARTRTPTTSTRAELDAFRQRELGTLTFRLADLAAVPDFIPDDHIGHKMQAKGYLVRQPNAERIGLSAMEMVDSTCGG
jgi:mono/diheme cytochrome c family protein